MSAKVTTTRVQGYSKPWMELWIEKLIEGEGHVQRASTAAGICRKTAYENRNTDEVFRDAWDDVVEALVDDVDVSTAVLARDGQVDRIYNKDGEEVGTRTTRYPQLNQFYLSSRRRDVYGKTEKVEHEIVSKGGLQVKLTHAPPDVHPKKDEEGAS